MERAAHASFGFENWEKELDRLPAREEGPADKPWVEEVDEHPGGRVSPRRLMEQGTPSTLETSLTSSVSASSGEIGESTMGDVCWRSAFTYFRRTSASCSRRTSESRDPGDGGAALEGCAASTESTGELREALLLAAREGVTTDGPALPAGASAVALGLRSVGQVGHGLGSL